MLQCISATLKRGDAEFIAYDGDFYSVNRTFVSRSTPSFAGFQPLNSITHGMAVKQSLTTTRWQQEITRMSSCCWTGR